MKLLILFTCLLGVASCGVLKKPKVYNALITTDENLTPSRAFPVVQPTIHETGFSSYPAFGIQQNPFGFYDPYATSYHGNFLPSGYQVRNQPFPYPLRSENPSYELNGNEQSEDDFQRQNRFNDQSSDDSQSTTLPPVANNDGKQRLQQADNENGQEENPQQVPPQERPPIPLNEFGLPPSLIPLSSFGQQQPQNPVNLQPYPYNSYPLIYDSFGGYNTNPYLPPYGYFPQVFAGGNQRPPQEYPYPYPQPQIPPQPTPFQPQSPNSSAEDVPSTSPSNSNEERDEKQKIAIDDVENAQQQQTEKTVTEDVIEIIKNNNNKNKDIPDVPAPPLPSGAKSASSENN